MSFFDVDGHLTFQSLVDQAMGDILGHLKFQCTNCGSRLTDAGRPPDLKVN